MTQPHCCIKFGNKISLNYYLSEHIPQEVPTSHVLAHVRTSGFQIKSVIANYFSYFSTKTYVVGTQKNRLNETVILSTDNTCLN